MHAACVTDLKSEVGTDRRTNGLMEALDHRNGWGNNINFCLKYVCGSQVGCYVHYPTISTDMLDAVQANRYIAKSTKLPGKPVRGF